MKRDRYRLKASDVTSIIIVRERPRRMKFMDVILSTELLDAIMVWLVKTDTKSEVI